MRAGAAMGMRAPPLVLTVLVLTLTWKLKTTIAQPMESRRSKCERITIPMCQDMPYNMTHMPNLMNHYDQNEAAIGVHEYIPLVEIGCSKHLKFFLCSLYAPMCSEQVDLPIPSCRSICEEVKTQCLPVLRQFDFAWPETLNCDRLPVPEMNELCMEFPNITEGGPGRANSNPGTGLSKFPQTTRRFEPPPAFPPIGGGRRVPSNFHPGVSGGCPDRFVHVDTLHRSTDITCIPRCGHDVFYRQSDKQFAAAWMGVWASLCFLSTLFTLLTFAINRVRFRYPERSIVYLSGCYNVYSVAYFIRLLSGSEAVSCEVRTSSIVLQGLDNTTCTIVFLLLYYFSLASCVWWVILTLTWYLAAGKKWGHEAIDSLSTYFHVAAWATPALLSIVVLTLRRVDGDELTGLCHVGQQDEHALGAFLIGPLAALFALGVLFIALGLAALFRIRRVMRVGGRNTDTLEKLMVRIGVFSVLYMVPAGGVLACLVYEYSQRSKWRTVAMLNAIECQIAGGAASSPACHLSHSIPSVEVLMLKIFLSLAVGITSGMWVWSSKTWAAWRQFYLRCTLPRQDRRKPTLPLHPHNADSRAPQASLLNEANLVAPRTQHNIA